MNAGQYPDTGSEINATAVLFPVTITSGIGPLSPADLAGMINVFPFSGGLLLVLGIVSAVPVGLVAHGLRSRSGKGAKANGWPAIWQACIPIWRSRVPGCRFIPYKRPAALSGKWIRILADIAASRYALRMEPNAVQNAFDTWRSLVHEAGASLEDGRVTGLPAPRTDSTGAAWMVPLVDRAWLAFRGEDARRFLHDQLTSGVADVDDSEMRLAAYCGPHGRALALLRVTGNAGELLVEMPGSLAETIARRLAMFVLRADVRIEPIAELAALGCWGEAAPDLLASRGMPVPDRPFAAGSDGQTTVTRLPGAAPRFQLTGPPASVTGAWQEWRTTASPVNTDGWQLQDIRAGLPDLGPETTDQFLPQSLALEHWHALSYRKGCFPGQEVIARAHYRGRLKRHLYHARVENPPPAPGDDVLDGTGRRAGNIISAAPVPGKGSELLAVLHERAESGCRLGSDTGTPLLDLAPVAP